LKIYINLFLIFTVLNGISILVGGLESKRAFGFAGIMFVDYAGIGLTQLSALFLLADKKRKIFLFPIITILGVALILTQTRGIWIITLISITLLFIFVYFQNKRFKVNRRHIIILFSFLLLTFSIFSIYTFSVNKNLSSRTEKIADTEKNIENVDVQSSLITRVFIWHTALNAFRKNPLTGIGIYTFPYVSRNYYTIPKLLYNRYVKNVTPHETYLTVLTETGILGFVGFFYLLFNMIRLNYRNLKNSISAEQKKYSLLLMFASVYIILAMIIGDAWLWGHGLVLWSIILGFSAANNKIIKLQNAVIK
jgi:O-antigen ligase